MVVDIESQEKSSTADSDMKTNGIILFIVLLQKKFLDMCVHALFM